MRERGLLPWLVAAVLLGSGLGSRAAGPGEQQTPATRVIAPAEIAPLWDYEGKGPATWGQLAPEFALCGSGKSQSPIDITAVRESSKPGIKADYRPAGLRIVHAEHTADVVHTGHSIQVNYAEGDMLTIDEDTYVLVQYHFHSPSEHTVKGRPFPMEMHLVHRSAQGRLAVLGVLIDEGQENEAFEPVWANLPEKKGVETHLENVMVDVNELLPRDRASYRYEGSLTTPPCSEGVKWIVMKQPVSLSAHQIEVFQNIIKGNNRPVQPLNGRAVYADKVKERGEKE
ncbi:MAG: carbonic anhydrase [Candidatus Acidiferrales bacterium]